MKSLSKLIIRSVLVLLGTVTAALALSADSPRPGRTSALNPVRRARIIEFVVQKLRETYVFPQVARAMEADIRQRMGRGEYTRIADGKRFAETLTRDLRAISHDMHLGVRFELGAAPGGDAPSAAASGNAADDFRRRGEAANWGFDRVERLAGNVGYLKSRFFMAPEFAGEKLAQAMGFLGATDALIVDLRENGGGAPEMVALFCSYFFAGDPVHLSDLYWHPDRSTQQFWTTPYLPVQRYTDKPVYVLTSRETISAAEGFAYDLQALKRATIVGETTGGYAHPGASYRIDENFEVVVPQGRTINAVTKTDWEGTGVKPEIEVRASWALQAAHVLALEGLMGARTDDAGRGRLSVALKDARRALERSGGRVPLRRGVVECSAASAGALVGLLEQDASRTPVPPGRLIDIGGYRLHLIATGRGDPSVVLIPGAGDYSFDWSLVQPDVARFTRVCSYDRAGSAWSDPGPTPRTMRQEAHELHMLLKRGGVRAPYILVGHSIGGLIARVYADLYPRELAGMVLVDSTHEDTTLMVNGKLVHIREFAKHRPVPPPQTMKSSPPNPPTDEDRKQADMNARVFGPPKIEPPFDKLPSDIQTLRLWMLSHPKLTASSEDYWADELQAMFDARAKTPTSLGDAPLAVMIGARKVDAPPPGLSPEDAQRMSTEKRQQKEGMAVLSRNSEVVYAIWSGHHIQLDEPNLVVSAIRRVVDAARTHARLSEVR